MRAVPSLGGVVVTLGAGNPLALTLVTVVRGSIYLLRVGVLIALPFGFMSVAGPRALGVASPGSSSFHDSGSVENRLSGGGFE
jgi:hypothetical protein